MLLVLDVGNTNIKLGIYDDKELLFSIRISTDRNKTKDEYLIEFNSLFLVYNVPVSNITGAIISSVVPQLTTALKDSLHTLTGVVPLVVGPGIKTGLNIKINDPATLGADIAVASVAATVLYPSPTIVFGLGTATTISVLDKNKSMVGGCISPGVAVSLSALIDKSSLLSSISIEAPKHVIGRSTDECIKSGAVIGTACMIDGMCERIEEELGETCTVIATGGLASLVTPSCKRKIEVCDHLILEGLRIIYERNS
ncbi:type III pantothenate kinase [Clostridia bacterium]|nr:type III pantothenate kinase [Clostridia bacterium]